MAVSDTNHTSALPAGAIAAIVIVVVLVVAGIAVASYMYNTRWREPLRIAIGDVERPPMRVMNQPKNNQISELDATQEHVPAATTTSRPVSIASKSEYNEGSVHGTVTSTVPPSRVMSPKSWQKLVGQPYSVKDV